jgi:D-psicose/D-tagatose/L-ribulose 3-epimerase
MKLSISSIAWSAEEEAEAIRMISGHGLKWIELAPARAFGRPEECERRMVEDWLSKLNGLRVSSFQALLFGRSEVHLFRGPEEREALHNCLTSLCRVAEWCGASAMVFGSPGNRKRGELNEDAATAIAADFFLSVGREAAARGTAFAIEPNPPEYNCDFLTNYHSAARFVRAVGSPGVVLNLDCGELILNAVPLDEEFDAALPWVGHVHISLPYLAPVTETHPVHAEVLRRLRQRGYDKFVTIEMKRPDGGLAEVELAVKAVQSLLGEV